MLITLFSSLTAAAGEVPKWVHLVPAGTFRGLDGRGPYRLEDAGAVIDASMATGKLALDENHSTDLKAPKGEPSPARGWIVEMEARADGIWGHVEWTRVGTALMEDRAYKGISPVISARAADGVVVGVLRASLTNTPNLTLTSLHHREPIMDLAALRAALGLDANASEADVLAAVTAAKTAVTTHSVELAKLAKAAGAAEGASADAIATHLQARGAGDVDALRGTVVELQSQLAILKQSGAREAAVRAVDEGINAGKVGLVPLRDHYISRHMVDPDGVAKEIAAMPSIKGGGSVASPAGARDATGLTPDEKFVCEQMGIDPAKYTESRKALGATTEVL